MKKTVMKMAVNTVQVDWDSIGRRKPAECSLAIRCNGELTQGRGIFADSRQPPVSEMRCCAACATAYVVQEGLKGTITIKQIHTAMKGGERR